MTRFLNLAGVVFALSTLGFSQTPVKFRISFVVVPQSDSPVKIIGIERRTGATSPVATVENGSSKPVKAVTVMLAVAAPKGCSPEEHQPVMVISNSGPDSFDYSAQEIAPQQRAVLRGVDIIASAAGHAPALKSRYLQVQLGVSKVVFTDGTSWTASTNGQVFSLANLQADAANCSDWPWIPAAFDNFQGKMMIGHASTGKQGTHVDTEAEWHPQPAPPSRQLPTRYSVDCETRDTAIYCELP